MPGLDDGVEPITVSKVETLLSIEFITTLRMLLLSVFLRGYNDLFLIPTYKCASRRSQASSYRSFLRVEEDP